MAAKDSTEPSQPSPDPNELPDEERLKQAATTAQKALDAQSTAESLKNAAKSVTDPKKREKMLRNAYDKEVEAHGNSKKARMLQSGAFQGAAGGAGIGGAVGAGVGTVIGTVVGTVTAIPATALGGLAGAGVGAAHGPWIKLPPIGGGKNSKEDNKKDTKGNDKKQDNEKKGDDEEEDEGVMPNPSALYEAADAISKEREKQGQGGDGSKGQEKKKPRKLEIRSKQHQKEE